MASVADILLNILKLSEDVQRINTQCEKLADKAVDLDKRLVRIETLVEVAKYQNKTSKLGND